MSPGGSGGPPAAGASEPDGRRILGNASGPSVVALGGGHGLAATLSAARRYAGRLTAVVSVADDGGSSGRLRAELGLPAPGDLRKCLVALASPGSIWAEAFEYRFPTGELAGHALGNLIIGGLAAATGDFLGALAESARLVAAVGEVLPATVEPVRLVATALHGAVVGQAAVAGTEAIASVALDPPDPEPPAAALEALATADQLVLGPGSLYTSVLAAVAAPRLRDALAASTGRLVYVANLRTQVPETTGYDVADHVAALEAHRIRPDVVLCDTTSLPLGTLTVPHVDVPLAASDGSGHDPARLAAALAELAPARR